MKNYQGSDYALNKFSDGIAYRFAGRTVKISLEDYLAENPGKTERNFMELKALSDSIYREQDRLENAQTNKNISIHGLEKTDEVSTASLEDEYIGRHEDEILEYIIQTHLTKKTSAAYPAMHLSRVEQPKNCKTGRTSLPDDSGQSGAGKKENRKIFEKLLNLYRAEPPKKDVR